MGDDGDSAKTRENEREFLIIFFFADSAAAFFGCFSPRSFFLLSFFFRGSSKHRRETEYKNSCDKRERTGERERR